MLKNDLNFLLRGNYPNYQTIEFALKFWENPATPIPIGYITPELEYWTDNQAHRIIEVDYFDMHFLSKFDKFEAKKYLKNLLEANNGNEKCKNLIHSLKQELYNEKKDFCSKKEVIENDFVIASTSKNKYNEVEISHKGTYLLQLIQEGYPVPDFCVISSKAYFENKEKRMEYMHQAITNLENISGEKLGSKDAPLVFAIRCAMPRYIPGLMPTYLNVGVTPESYEALKKIYGNLVAGKIYLHNLKSIAEYFIKREDISKGISNELSYSVLELETKIKSLYNIIAEKDERILIDPYYQVALFLDNAYEFYKKNQDLLFTFIKNKGLSPSFILQKMIWTIRDDDSYPGVLYSRQSRTGIGYEIESVRNIFGEEIMSGTIDTEHTSFIKREEIKEKFPAIYHFTPLLTELEKKIKSPATVEFAAESNNQCYFFALLQLNASELTGRSTLLSAIDLYKKNIIDRKKVLELIHPYHLRQIFSETINKESLNKLRFFSKGLSVLPRSAVSAKAYFTAETALEAKKNGEKVCFIKERFIPSDTIVMSEVDAIISLTPVAIHVVTACRGFGIPAFLNLSNYKVRLVKNFLISANMQIIREGDWITLSSKNQIVFEGKADYTPARFQRYLEGIPIDLEEREKIVFEQLSEAYNEYQNIVNSVDLGEIMNLNELIKYIRTNLNNDLEKAKTLINGWYDNYTDYYIEQVLTSELGTHRDQHDLFEKLEVNRKIDFFRKAISHCLSHKTSGYTAGSFMLGRFICIPLPLKFWKELNNIEISFLLNEYILFEKYLYLLHEIGEHHLTRAKTSLQKEGLGEIILNIAHAKIFTTLKLSKKNWDEIYKNKPHNTQKEFDNLISMLKLPFGEIYDFESSWSISKLVDICNNEGIETPDPKSI
jgi:hypothetical protein